MILLAGAIRAPRPFPHRFETMNIPTPLKVLMAAGSVGACVALFGIMVFLARVVPTGGVEPTVSTLIMIGSFVPAFLIGWASFVFMQQLSAEAKREKARG